MPKIPIPARRVGPSGQVGAVPMRQPIGADVAAETDALARTLDEIGGDFASLTQRILRSQTRSQVVEGQLTYDENFATFKGGLLNDPDYRNWPNKYRDWHKKQIQAVTFGDLIPVAKQQLSLWGRDKYVGESVNIGIDSYNSTIADERAKWEAAIIRAESTGEVGPVLRQTEEMIEDGALREGDAELRLTRMYERIDASRQAQMKKLTEEARLATIRDSGEKAADMVRRGHIIVPTPSLTGIPSLVKLPTEERDARDFLLEQAKIHNWTSAEQSLAESYIVQEIKQQNVLHEKAQEAAYSDLLASVLDNNLVDPTIITQHLRNETITPEVAKSLHNYITNPKPPETSPIAHAEVLMSINAIGTGRSNKMDALNTIMRNIDRLDPALAKSLSAAVFGKIDKRRSELKSSGEKNLISMMPGDMTIMGIYIGGPEDEQAFRLAQIDLNDWIDSEEKLPSREKMYEQAAIFANERRRGLDILPVDQRFAIPDLTQHAPRRSLPLIENELFEGPDLTLDDVREVLAKVEPDKRAAVEAEVSKLVTIWDELTTEEKISVYRKIAVEGWTGSEILSRFKNAK